MATGDVKATFVGHDHTNDFCKKYQGVQLCYEGSPGYQAYGREGWPRRSRVTLIQDYGRRVVSWKRLDDLSASVVDRETLWSAAGDDLHGSHDEDNIRVIRNIQVDSLIKRSQPH